MKKKFLPAYSIPVLVRGNSRYYIKVKALTRTGKQVLYRHTFDLNRIHSLPNRIKRGDDLIRKIRYWLAKGNLYEDFDERTVTIDMKIMRLNPHKYLLKDLIEQLRDEKISETQRRSSVRSHQSHSGQFLEFLKLKGWEYLMVEEFTREHARLYVNYWIQTLKISNNNTFNTKLTYIRGYFNVFVDREYIHRNPFEKIKSRRKTKAERKHFTTVEMAVLNKMAKERSVWLWAAIQLAFWGLIRQEELSRLKFNMFDVKHWCIRMRAEHTKNWKDDIITLPTFLREEFMEIDFFRYPANYYVFGKKLSPGNEKINERKLHKRFLTILNRAVREKVIEDKTGYSFSCWRRTGMDYYSYRLTPRQFKDHNRHESFATTEHYLPNRKLIPEISVLNKDVFC